FRFRTRWFCWYMRTRRCKRLRRQPPAVSVIVSSLFGPFFSGHFQCRLPWRPHKITTEFQSIITELQLAHAKGMAASVHFAEVNERIEQLLSKGRKLLRTLDIRRRDLHPFQDYSGVADESWFALNR